MWWFVALRVQCSSIGAFPLYWIVFISYFYYSGSVFKPSLAAILVLGYSANLAKSFAGSFTFFLGFLVSSAFFYTLAYFFYSSFLFTVVDFSLPLAFFGLDFYSTTLTFSCLDRLDLYAGTGSSLTFFLPSAFPAAALFSCSFFS